MTPANEMYTKSTKGMNTIELGIIRMNGDRKHE